MLITFLGHAGLKVTTSRATVLIDPWLSPRGAFQASWFQFPENEHLVEPALFSPTAVVVSHEHLDHLDPWTLSRIAPDVPVVIHRYPSPVLRRKLEACGRQVVEIGAWEWFEIAEGTRVLFVPEESPMNHDAGILLVGDEHVLVNLNDARLTPSQLRAMRSTAGGRVDLFTFQAAGASWHPMCYEFTEEHKRELSRQKRVAKLAYASRVIKAVDPTMAAPFAGPPCFLDPTLFGHNSEMDEGVFPDQHQATEWLRRRRVENVTAFLPGDTWDTEGQCREPSAKWDGFSFEDREPYLRDYARRRSSTVAGVLAEYPDPPASLWEPFRDYFEHLLTLSPYFNRRVGMRVGFDISGPGGGAWAVDFRDGQSGARDEMAECAVIYRLKSRWLAPILAGQVLWEDFFLSLRFRVWRHPDVHNEHLLGVLKFAEREALDRVEDYETTAASGERVLIHADGATYSVQRRCPHAGADLLDTSEVLPGRVLRCLNHYYEFDLESGACLNGVCDPLDAERVEDQAPAPAAPSPHIE